MTGSVHKDLSQLKHQIMLSLMLSAFDLFSDWLCHGVLSRDHTLSVLLHRGKAVLSDMAAAAYM